MSNRANILSSKFKEANSTVCFFYLYEVMKAIIKVCTAADEFTEDQKQILRRISNVLTEHNLSVAIVMKIKKYKVLKIKAG